MRAAARWDRCTWHAGDDATEFLSTFFADEGRRPLIVGGAGFDPRATAIPTILRSKGATLAGFFIREERADAHPELHRRAEANVEALARLASSIRVESVDIFDVDKAVIGARRLIDVLRSVDLTPYTDVIVDVSSLSTGIFFPLVKYLASQLSPDQNLHVTVQHHPAVDTGIDAIASDKVEAMLGFDGRLGLEESASAAKLWVPTLIKGRRGLLERIFTTLRPDEVCPVLPFPASNPRLPDELIEYYSLEFESTWRVDPHNIVYAHEGKPLDLYRTLLRIDDMRRRVFSDVGGSLVILSPVGSKVLSIGALMAALERELPVQYAESLSYEVDFATVDRMSRSPGEILHVWLQGEAYISKDGV